jgi:hypothetical protein
LGGWLIHQRLAKATSKTTYNTFRLIKNRKVSSWWSKVS